jgi:chaperone modulatory protein CbpM
MDLDTLTARLPDLRAVEITTWVERGWVRPDADPSGRWVFQEIDVARVRLIRDLRRELELAEDAVPVVLSLLDQVYELRRVLSGVARAVDGQPADVRAAVLEALRAPPVR